MLFLTSNKTLYFLITKGQKERASVGGRQMPSKNLLQRNKCMQTVSQTNVFWSHCAKMEP